MGRDAGSRARHPLVVLIKTIRKRHPQISLPDIEVCMNIPIDTLRHIEKGRRPLPGLQDGLSKWIARFLDCVHATVEERQQVRLLAARVLLLEWGDELDEEWHADKDGGHN
jgi:hypothetical protein